VFLQPLETAINYTDKAVTKLSGFSLLFVGYFPFPYLKPTLLLVISNRPPCT
jgi:hypothetical protein